MEFFGALAEYLVSFVILVATAIAGLFLGKYLRVKKNQKSEEK